MKRYIFMLIAIIFVAAIAFTSLSNGKTKTIKEGGVLSVNDIQADPFAYKDTITINGVVAAKDPSDLTVFAIIETSAEMVFKIKDGRLKSSS